jgi:hypothetical protein
LHSSTITREFPVGRDALNQAVGAGGLFIGVNP